MSATPVSFCIEARRGNARSASLTVRGRTTKTPAFMPVGTQGTVKGIPGHQLHEMGYRAALANTYHLHLRPGEETVARLGGVHRMMDFPGIILTDSGGFQVFSLSERNVVDDEGITFQSHLDGNRIRLTPHRAMEIQHALDSDIAMVLDECPPADASAKVLEEAVRRSIDWAGRCWEHHRSLSHDRAVFAISQGGKDPVLRRQMIDELTTVSFDGFALGGISVGEDRQVIRDEILAFTQWLPEDRPRYLMGVGSPRELFLAVRQGVDLFDCVMPTRNARNGHLYTREGILKMRNAIHAEDPRPVEADCPCTLCVRYSRGTLRHLLHAREMLGPMLATEHNLTFLLRLIQDLRRWVERGDAAVDFDWLDRHYP